MKSFLEEVENCHSFNMDATNVGNPYKHATDWMNMISPCGKTTIFIEFWAPTL